MPESTGARGRLAQMIATRGGLAPPEDPFVIEHREALFYMLCEASELEHGIMCQYLYAAFSLKQSADEGLTAAEAEAVQRWRKHIFHIGRAGDAAPGAGAEPADRHRRGPAPVPAELPAARQPLPGRACTWRWCRSARRRCATSCSSSAPRAWTSSDAAGMAAFANAAPAAVPRVQVGEIVPRGQDFATVGHLYRSIEAGIAHLAEKLGEDGAVHRAVAGAGHRSSTSAGRN